MLSKFFIFCEMHRFWLAIWHAHWVKFSYLNFQLTLWFFFWLYDYPNNENFFHSFLISNDVTIFSKHSKQFTSNFLYSWIRTLSCLAFTRLLLFLVSFLTFRRLFKWIYRNNFYIFERECRHHISTTSTEIRRRKKPNGNSMGECAVLCENSIFIWKTNKTAQFNHDTINHREKCQIGGGIDSEWEWKTKSEKERNFYILHAKVINQLDQVEHKRLRKRRRKRRKKCQKIFLMVFYRVQHTPTSFNVGRRFAVKLRWILWSIHARLFYDTCVWPKMSKSENVRFNLEIDFSFFFKTPRK